MGASLLSLSLFGFCRDTSLLRGINVRALSIVKKNAKILTKCGKKLVEVINTYIISSGLCFTVINAVVVDVNLQELEESLKKALKGTETEFALSLKPLRREELERIKGALGGSCGR